MGKISKQGSNENYCENYCDFCSILKRLDEVTFRCILCRRTIVFKEKPEEVDVS